MCFLPASAVNANVLVKVLCVAGLPWGLPGPSARARSTAVRREVESPYPARCVCPARGSMGCLRRALRYERRNDVSFADDAVHAVLAAARPQAR